jgi:siroheme synthase
VLSTTLERLPEEVSGAGFAAPVLLVIGRVVSLMGWQAWAEGPADGEASLAGQLRHG